jgi:hypothetical protein
MALVRTDVSEEHIASVFREARLSVFLACSKDLSHVARGSLPRTS